MTEINIELDVGAAKTLPFVYKDPDGNLINLTGYSAKMQVRASLGATAALVTVTSALNGGIVIGGAAGTITVTVPAAQTAALPPKGKGVYDLVLIDGSNTPFVIAKGTVYFAPMVTSLA